MIFSIDFSYVPTLEEAMILVYMPCMSWIYVYKFYVCIYICPYTWLAGILCTRMIDID